MRSGVFFSILLLGVSSIAIAKEFVTLTLDEVDSQVSSFLQGIQNETLAPRGDRTVPTLPSGCDLACDFLNFTLPGQISYPRSPTYEFQESRYWSVQQASTKPACRFSPKNPLGVSRGVLTVQVTQCKFAVKSGGHVAFAGGSNIDRGMTMDLINLNQITVSPDKTETAVGPGNRWFDVYQKLEPFGLSVVGGRVSDIGVGGLTLGGGISFFSGRYGWACDNVNKYQLVFADGSIKEVNQSIFPDLYSALRGGGNNFGIVTRFDLVTFPQDDLWAGAETFLYEKNTSVALNNAFYNLGINSPSDPFAQVILAYACVQSSDEYFIASDLQYGKPVVNPPILQNFTAVPGAISNTLRITPLTKLTEEFNNTNPGGFRQSYWALMVRNSATLMSDIVDIFMEETGKVKDAPGLVFSCIFQPVTTNQMHYFTKNGGNPLGLSDNDGPLNLINIAISWSDEADEERILTAARNLVNRSNRLAYSQGLGNRFLYQNYASKEQVVFQSYGEKNFVRLRSISRKYDPNGVWQKLQPGYFKLGL